jgi:hypothetical protein
VSATGRTLGFFRVRSFALERCFAHKFFVRGLRAQTAALSGRKHTVSSPTAHGIFDISGKPDPALRDRNDEFDFLGNAFQLCKKRLIACRFDACSFD